MSSLFEVSVGPLLDCTLRATTPTPALAVPADGSTRTPPGVEASRLPLTFRLVAFSVTVVTPTLASAVAARMF